MGWGHIWKIQKCNCIVRATLTVSVQEDSLCVPRELGVVSSSVFKKSDLCNNQGFHLSWERL